MRHLLPTLGPPTDGRSWFLSYHFHRPLGLDWKTFKRALRTALKTFDPAAGSTPIQICRGFELDLIPASKPHPNRFLPGVHSDLQAGGFVLGEIIKNAQLCAFEKAEKIAAYRQAYPEWWLLLVNHIDPYLDAEERDQLRGHMPEGPWTKILLLDPRLPSRSLAL